VIHELLVTDHPFPHVVLDGYWDDDLLRDVVAEFPSTDVPAWRVYNDGRNESRKYEGPPVLWGPRTRELFDLFRQQTDALARAFDTPDLTMETIGGGYHLIEPGGYLNMHTDFNRSPRSGLHRRLNLIVYLNENWDDPGGHLQLWDHDGLVVDVPPEFNRTVIFETSDHSWHGHPVPAQRWRRSVAAYYFTEEPPPGYTEEHSTVWHPNNGQS
jgi:hypothetical protein